jgi:penicillin-binding protein 1C
MDGRKKTVFGIFFVLLIFYCFSLPRNLFNVPFSVVVESSNGELLGARIAADGQWRFKMIDTVPDKFKRAILTYEDKRFNYHFGIDPLAFGRAIVQNIKSKKVVSGGSTITMQVVRLSREKKRTFFEKIIEIILATRLEFRCSKEEILRLYSSNAPFGGNVVGLEAASWRYFGRSPDILSWAETATLAVLPNSPALIHISKNRDKLLNKRNRLLDKLSDAGFISKQEAVLYKHEELPDKPYPLPMFVYHLTSRINREKGDALTKTTLDYNLQQKVNYIAKNKNEFYRLNKVENIAILVAEVKTGNILAYIGNVRNEDNTKNNGSNVDIIIAPRSSGSVFKPLLFAGMLDAGDILQNTLIPDIPFHYQSFAPQNYNRTFDGAVSAHRVLERSLNVPSVRLLQSYGIERFHALLKKLGFTTINRTPDNYGLTLILGGAECTLWDLVSVYTNMAQKMISFNDTAQFILPLNYYKNNTVKNNNPKDYPFCFASLWLTFETLSKLNRPEEESEWQSFSSSRKVAWKTGTSYGNRDAWSIGITPEYVVGVWVGNASGEGRPLLTGIGYAAPVMFEVFSLLPQTNWFSMPEIDMEQAVICRKSGHLATSICEPTDTLWIPREGNLTPACPYHIEVNVSMDGKYRVNSLCESVSNMQRKSYFVLPPAQELYYKTKNADYKPLPLISPKCLQSFGQNPMEIIYPQNGFTVVIPRKLDTEKSNVVFHAAHRNPQTIIFWHIDDRYICSTQHEHKIAVCPPAGFHTLTLIDSDGFSVQVKFNVK